MSDYSDEDIGNIISLEHVNVQIPDQALATLFYVVGLGCTRDPYLNVGLNNMWANIGEQQFHLPTRSPQVIDGYIGLVVPHFEGLVKRLESIAEGLKGTQFSFQQEGELIDRDLSLGQSFPLPPQPNGIRRHGRRDALRRVRRSARRHGGDLTFLSNSIRRADRRRVGCPGRVRPREDRPASVAIVSRNRSGVETV